MICNDVSYLPVWNYQIISITIRFSSLCQIPGHEERTPQIIDRRIQFLIGQLWIDFFLDNSSIHQLFQFHFCQFMWLIDEYDVPLAKANENGYYDEMVLLIRNLFENGLKTNKSLKFAILTGCLRVAKESIFTGLNNFKIYSITDKSFDETFGFTDSEVREPLCAQSPDVITG